MPGGFTHPTQQSKTTPRKGLFLLAIDLLLVSGAAVQDTRILYFATNNNNTLPRIKQHLTLSRGR